MNCQQGDLARVKITHPENESERRMNGHIVICEKLVQHPVSGEPGWLISPKIPTWYGNIIGILDSCLIPYRPGNEPDETLEWAPVPGVKKPELV